MKLSPNQQLINVGPDPLDFFEEGFERLVENVASVVVTSRGNIQLALLGLFAQGHILLEDLPGVGKTLMAKTIAASIEGHFSRIQFTPDLLPSDIMGRSVYNTNQGTFTFNRGPLFANIVLADEINRTPPRTQSALLEAMSDRQVSADGETHELPNPFMVVATQNPFEFEGTYPLPESQLDRFLFRISLGYPDRDEEKRVLVSHRENNPVDILDSVITAEQVTDLQQAVRNVAVDDSIYDYLLDIVTATRESEELHVGVSTRGALSLYRASQSLALIRGRDFVVPDDVKELTIPTFSHRVISKGYLHGSQRDAIEGTMRRLVETIPVPA